MNAERGRQSASAEATSAATHRGRWQGRWARWASLGLLLSLSAPALATKFAAPEMLFVIDSSASMQYRMGAQEAPDCSAVPPQMSRYNAVREMLEGTFNGFGCTTSDLPAHPDAIKPHVQVAGPPVCIPGLTYGTGDGVATNGSNAVKFPIGSKSHVWGGGATVLPSDLKLVNRVGETALPYLSFNVKGLGAVADPWKSGVLTLNVPSAEWLDPKSKTQTIWVYLVSIAETDVSLTGTDFVCSINTSSPAAVSAPVQVPLGGGKIALSLTTAALADMKSQYESGTENFYYALVPAQSYMNAKCAGRFGSNFDYFKFEISNVDAGDLAPRFEISTGSLACVGEGPTTHSQATGAPALDGALDVYFSTSKFSVIFLDNVLSTDTGQAGGWSLAQNMSSYWDTINIGAADPKVVTSISEPITGAESQIQRQVTYDNIKAKLAALKPNGGTPLAAFLADVSEYLGPGPYKDPHWSSIQEDPVNADKWSACRFRYITLMTDGGANLHGGSTDGRNEALAAAAAIWAKGIAVYVVAVGHANPDPTNPPPVEDLTFLDALANAGGTDKAAVISTPGELIKLLRAPLGDNAISNEVLTRAEFIRPRYPEADVGYSFHALSRFDVAEPMHTSGVLEQRIYRCEGACKDLSTPGRARVCEVLDYATRLKDRKTARTFFSQVGAKAVPLDKFNVAADAMGIAKTGLAPKLVVDAGGNCVTQAGTFDLANPIERNSYRDHLLETVRADVGSCRKGYEFGAVAYAQPALLEPADKMGLRDPVATLYATRAMPVATPLAKANPPGSKQRPTMVFSATHDGILHAFRADRDTNVDLKVQGGLVAGDEMWAWLPAFNLNRVRQLKLVSEAKRSYLGGAVVARHTLLDRAAGTLADQAMRWRSVVLVGAGEAGAGYTALDVSVPQAPQLMWEITPDRHCFGTGKVGNISGPNCVASSTFGGMGRSTARPVLGSVFVVRDGKPQELAVAIIPSGKPAADSAVENIGVDGTSAREIYVVALENGELIRKFDVTDLDMTGITTSVTKPEDELGYFWTEPACFNAAPGQLVTRCFIGDSKGMLWRIDLSSTDTSQWKVQWFHDAYSGSDTPAKYVLSIGDADRVPVLAPPSVARAADGRITVVYGTGDRKDEASNKRRHLVYSVAEKFTLAGGGTATRAQADRIWLKDIGDGGRFVGPPVIFDSHAYWASYTVLENKYCEIGKADIWGGRFDRPKTPSDPQHMLGAFTNPAKPADLTANLEKLFIGDLEPSPVDVQPVPSCAGGCPPTDPSCLIGAGGALGADPQAYELVVGNAGSSPGDTAQTPKTGNQPSVGASVQRLRQPRSTAVVTGWDVILD